jgi:pimeloyl-ACP methyl ester carboxylesterase
MVAAAIQAATPKMRAKSRSNTKATSAPEAEKLRPPPLALTLAEGRGVIELAATFATQGILRRAPKGDGHTVLVLPGFLASDRSTKPIRAFLDELGYDTHGWGQGQNLGKFYKMREVLEALVNDIHAKSGSKISIVGWSLGGVFARYLSLVMPEKVRSVITLGSPFAADIHATSAKRLYELLSQEGPAKPGDLERIGGDLPVPNTSIYTKLDGIVNWKTCIAKPADNAETIEIRLASHVGIGVNPAAFWATADRLAQPEGSFTPFAKNGPFAFAYG